MMIMICSYYTREVETVGKVRDVIDSLSLDELRKMKFDLESGGRHLRQLVERKIKELETRPMSQCVVCGKKIEDRDDNLTLLFGPDNFRRKATFCAHDCMDYFLNKQRGVIR